MIKSEPQRGQIYAGDTPLACTISLEQTGPLELIVRAGQLTTTGQAHLVEVTQENAAELAQLIAEGLAESLPDGRVRVWRLDEAGQPLKAQTWTLSADQVITLEADPVHTLYTFAALGIWQGQAELLVGQRLDNGLGYADPPAGWQPLQILIFEFALPPGATELGDIYVLTVLPGFPPGTTAADWQTQGGQV
jgi:hypothetical protein